MNKCSLLGVISLFLIMALVSFPSDRVFAHTDSFPWTWNINPTQLRVQRFRSADVYASDVQAVWRNWNDISTNIRLISLTTTTATPEDLGHEIQIIGQPLSGDTMARTAIWTKDSKGNWIPQLIATFTGQVQKAIITLDTRIDGLQSYGDTQQRKTIMHELGHALALSHPSCNCSALMHQTYNPPAAMTIQYHDKNHLRAKWD